MISVEENINEQAVFNFLVVICHRYLELKLGISPKYFRM